MPIRQVAREPLRKLRARTGHTASLAVLWGTEVAYIDRWQGLAKGSMGSMRASGWAFACLSTAAELQAVASMDREAVMQRLICREWLTALAAADRCDQVLGGYRLAPQFMASVEDRRIATPVTRIAFACAMVACGRASELPGLEPHPWREGKSGGGNDPQAVRENGAKAWMCNLGRSRGAARLFYWLLPDGVIEFDSVRNHQAISRT